MLSLLVLVIGLRIPFKKTSHWLFPAAVVSEVVFSVLTLARNPELRPVNSPQWNFDFQLTFLFSPGPQFPLLYHAALKFLGQRLSRLQKYSPIGAYAWGYGVVGFPGFVDTQLYFGPIRQTSTGPIVTAGTLSPYLFPFGVDIGLTTLFVFSLLAFRQLLHSGAGPLVRTQLAYMIGGLTCYVLFAYTLHLAVAWIHGPRESKENRQPAQASTPTLSTFKYESP